MPIITRAMFEGLKGAEDHRLSFAKGAAHRGAPIPDFTKVDVSAIVQAYINRGRWVADCPYCPSAEEVSPEFGFFYCTGSDHQLWSRSGRGPFVLEFPVDRDKLEGLLEPRHPRNRNWVVGETAADLETENIAHGIEVN